MLFKLLYKQRHYNWQNVLFFVLPIFIFVASLVLAYGTPVQAVTSSTLNFQGRLLSDTGALVADGDYNIEFNLYTVDGGGTSLWTETRLNSAAQGVTVQDGYFSVYLGDVTTFPGSINWDQEQWLGMTVRGTGSCAFGACAPTDSEMTPRFKLTAVPYAFRAGAVVDSAGNAYTGDDLAQIAPTNVQVVNSALAALRLNQTGSGSLLQFQGDGSDVFTLDKTGAATLGAGITIGNSSSSNAGTVRWSGSDLEVYDGSGWVSLTSGSGGGGTLSFDGFYAYDSVGAINLNSGWTDLTLDTEVKEDTPFTHGVDSAEVTINEDGWYEITYNVSTDVTSGASRSDSEAKIQEDKGAGYIDVPGTLGQMYNRQATQGGNSTSVTILREFVTGDKVKVQARRISGANTVVTSADGVGLTIKKFVTASGGGSATAFEQNGNAFGTTAILGTTDANGLNIITNNITTLSFTSAGAATFTNGLTLSTGDLALGGGDVTGSGDITGSAGLTLASGGAGDLTLDSASDVLVLSDATLQRNAAGTTVIDLFDASAGTTLEISNSDVTQVAGLTIEGGISAVGSISAGSFSGGGSGLTDLNGANITAGTIADARLSANVALLDTAQTFSTLQTFNSGLVVGNSAVTATGSIRWSGVDFEGYDGTSWVSLTGAGAPLLEGVLAFGKVDGPTGNPLNIEGATVVRNGTGDYTVTLNAAATTANYTVLLTAEEPTATLDDTKITIDNQTTIAFDVDIREGDNGTAADVRIDRDWHFTVLDPDAVAGGGSGTGGGGTSFDQGGNGFGVTALLGTTDNFGLNIVTNGSSALTFTSAGAANFINSLNASNGLTVSSGDLTAQGKLLRGTLATPDATAQAAFYTGGTTNKGLVVQGAALQSANIFEIQDNSGNALAGFNPSGALVLGNSTISSSATVSRAISFPDEGGVVCLSGSDACGFLKLASGAHAVDATLDNSIAINKTGASGSLISLQKNGGVVFTVNNTGSLQIQSTSSTALDIRSTGGTSYLTVDTTTGLTTVDTLAITNGISGAGLADCDSEYDVLQWDVASGLFSCHDSSPVVFQGFDNIGGTNLNTASLTLLPLGAETTKSTGITHDNVTDNSRVTLDVAGWYRLDYNVSTDNGGNGRVTLRCVARLNGTTIINQSSSYSYIRSSTDDNGTNTAGFLFETTADNEYIEILCQQGGTAGTSNSLINESWVVVEKR